MRGETPARYPDDSGFILTAVIFSPVSRIARNTVVPDVKLERGPNSSNFTDRYDIVSCRLLKYAILEKYAPSPVKNGYF